MDTIVQGISIILVVLPVYLKDNIIYSLLLIFYYAVGVMGIIYNERTVSLWGGARGEALRDLLLSRQIEVGTFLENEFKGLLPKTEFNPRNFWYDSAFFLNIDSI